VGFLLTGEEERLVGDDLGFAFGLCRFGGVDLLQFEAFALSLAHSFVPFHLIFDKGSVNTILVTDL
jgi:hypothetical protein